MESWLQDLRYSLRVIAKNPSFIIVAILALGLGIVFWREWGMGK